MIPGCVEFGTLCSRISPFLAYETIFRASSEMAVAMRVASAAEKPNAVASVLPFCLAPTMS